MVHFYAITRQEPTPVGDRALAHRMKNVRCPAPLHTVLALPVAVRRRLLPGVRTFCIPLWLANHRRETAYHFIDCI